MNTQTTRLNFGYIKSKRTNESLPSDKPRCLRPKNDVHQCCHIGNINAPVHVHVASLVIGDDVFPLGIEVFVVHHDVGIDLDAISEDFAINTIVTHTAPSFCELTSKGGSFAEMAIRDEGLAEDVKCERQMMDKILDYLASNHHPLRHWFYGHFHQSWQAIDNEGIQYNMLDIMELKELRAAQE